MKGFELFMGLTSSSTGTQVNEKDIFEKAIGCDYTIAIAGNFFAFPTNISGFTISLLSSYDSIKLI